MTKTKAGSKAEAIAATSEQAETEELAPAVEPAPSQPPAKHEAPSKAERTKASAKAEPPIVAADVVEPEVGSSADAAGGAETPTGAAMTESDDTEAVGEAEQTEA